MPDSTPRTTFFVSPHGSDANPGSRERPLATLRAAADRVRDVRAAGHAPVGGLHIRLLPGDYRLREPLKLTADHSGTANCPLVIAARDGRVRLTGGIQLNDWRPVTDEATRNRLSERIRDDVREADIPADAIDDIAGLSRRGFVGQNVPAAHAELFFNDRPMTLAQHPRPGHWCAIADLPEGSLHGDNHGSKIADADAGFHYDDPTPATWPTMDDVWLHGYWAWDWANTYEPLAEHDADRRYLRFATREGDKHYGLRIGQRFCFVNVLDALSRPGDYHVDRAQRKVRFLPPAPLDEGEAWLSLDEGPLVQLDEADHVHLVGLDLQLMAVRGHAIRITGGRHCRVADVTLRHIGSRAVNIEGGQGHTVERCHIAFTGDGGVFASGGDRQTLTRGDHRVSHCHFHDIARWSRTYHPAVLFSGVGLTADHNLIHDHPHCAILFNGNEITIEANAIHHVCMETGDVGAIYTGRDYTFQGNRVINNHIARTGGVGMGSMGMYLDDCVGGCLVQGNTFEKVTRAVFIGGGRDIQVLDNHFIDCVPAINLDARGCAKNGTWSRMVNDFMAGQLRKVPRELYCERYPHLAEIYEAFDNANGQDIEMPPAHLRIANNRCEGGHWLNLTWGAPREVLEAALDLGANVIR